MKRDLKNKACQQDDHSGETNRLVRLSEIVPPLLRWYDSSARILPWRGNPSPYAVWISEIMLQQTRVEAVKPYFDRWMKAFPDLPSLAAASEAEVLKLWEGLGYYSRARNIHRAARLVMEQHGGSLPSTFDELRSLPGVGEYTAGAVGSIAFRLPVPCVDGNVLRVVSRLAADKADIGSTAVKKRITEHISRIIPHDRPGDFNQAMMELGATVCLPNGLPKCEVCPVASLCEAFIQNRVTEFPVKSEKPPRRIEKKTVLILLKNAKAKYGAKPETATGAEHGAATDRTDALAYFAAADDFTAGPESGEESASVNGATAGGSVPVTAFRTALRKRPEKGLLAGLWEFPNYDGTLTEEEVRQILKASGLSTVSLTKLKNAKHIFTHIEWEMTGYLAFIEHERYPDGTAESEQEYRAAPDKTESDRHAPNGNGSGIPAPGFQWVGLGRLEERLALPSAFKTYHQILKQYAVKFI